MKHEKDYSLLRPFDIEAAKRGEAIMLVENGKHLAKNATFVAGPDSNGCIILNISGRFSRPDRIYRKNIFMAPLAWVEGRPVYRGDVLYWKSQPGAQCIAEKIMEGGWLAFRSDGSQPLGIVHTNGLTWTPPMVKREIKMLAYLTGRGALVWRDADAGRPDGWRRVPAEDKEI